MYSDQTSGKPNSIASITKASLELLWFPKIYRSFTSTNYPKRTIICSRFYVPFPRNISPFPLGVPKRGRVPFSAAHGSPSVWFARAECENISSLREMPWKMPQQFYVRRIKHDAFTASLSRAAISLAPFSFLHLSFCRNTHIYMLIRIK